MLGGHKGGPWELNHHTPSFPATTLKSHLAPETSQLLRVWDREGKRRSGEADEWAGVRLGDGWWCAERKKTPCLFWGPVLLCLPPPPIVSSLTALTWTADQAPNMLPSSSLPSLSSLGPLPGAMQPTWKVTYGGRLKPFPGPSCPLEHPEGRPSSLYSFRHAVFLEKGSVPQARPAVAKPGSPGGSPPPLLTGDRHIPSRLRGGPPWATLAFLTLLRPPPNTPVLDRKSVV